MSVFGAYARYYDLYYGDKDYAGEASFVHALLADHGASKADVLELGCGTGRHASELSSLGHRVHGVDLSETMLGRAEALASEDVTFALGDARTYRAGRTFGAVISLFHVMSYHTTNDDLLAAITTASEHLPPGGVFLFDCWYGPAVLSERPERREKMLSDGSVEVTRVAIPTMYPERDVCEVAYRVTLRDLATGAEERIDELHPMRYLFSPELELACRVCGFEVVESCEWMSRGPLGFGTWNATFVARKL